MNLSIFSFFSGVGFLDLGFEKEGYDIVYVNECHTPFLGAYKYARDKMKIAVPPYGYHDVSIEDLIIPSNTHTLVECITKERRNNRLVGFIGGPPCPDFATGGKNRGKHGDNGRLSQTYVELITRLNPDFFLFENVQGLWRTHKHREFYEQLKLQLKRSCFILAERLINAIEYGTPQDRERIILFGINSKTASDLHIAFDIRGKMIKDSQFPWLKYTRYPGKEAFRYNWPTHNKFVIDSVIEKPKGIPEELTIEYWLHHNDVINHPNALHCFKPRAGLKRFQTIAEGDSSGKSFKRLHRWRYSPAAAYGHNEVHLHPYKARRISVAEALAIQSLPSVFELPDYMSLTDMFKGIGNGVPYLAARMIARSIKEVLHIPDNISNGYPGLRNTSFVKECGFS